MQLNVVINKQQHLAQLELVATFLNGSRSVLRGIQHGIRNGPGDSDWGTDSPGKPDNIRARRCNNHKQDIRHSQAQVSLATVSFHLLVLAELLCRSVNLIAVFLTSRLSLRPKLG